MLTCYFPLALQAQDVIKTNSVVDSIGKKDLIDIAQAVFHIKPHPVKNKSGREVYFSFLPISSNVPGGGRALITSTTAGFYLGPRDSTYLSGVTLHPI